MSALVTVEPPPAPVRRPGLCGALARRDDPSVHCPNEAILFPCGWRCDHHRPGATRLQLAAKETP